MRRMSRKEFLGIGAASGVVLAGSGLGALYTGKEHRHSVAFAQTRVNLQPFLDPLPVPNVLSGATVNLSLTQFAQRLHGQLPLTQVWGYNGTYPGPTIAASQGAQTTVNYANNLPRQHLLKVDPTIVQMRGKPQNSRILTHLHGGHISDASDGNPYATTVDFMRGMTQTVTYANDQEAAQLWYHDHAMGITRLNVMAGLAGNYLLRDAVDTGDASNFGGGSAGLPFGGYEVPLVIQDRAFTSRGQISYPSNWQPEFFGDTALVNGKVWPFHDVEPRRYRFRVLNGSNSRFYHLRLSNDQPMTQIGSDGGLFPAPVSVGSLILAPAERADIVIDFSAMSGNVDLLDTPLPATTVSPGPPLARPEIMRFRVGASVTTPDKPLPGQLGGSGTVPGPVAQTRFLTLEEVLAGPVPRALLLNGLHFAAPVTETPGVGTTEEWVLINVSADTHPIHVHLVQFEVIERRQLDVAGYQGALNAARAAGQPNPDPAPFLGAQEPVDDNERGPKDTVRANPNQITRIRARFDLPAGVQTPAKYVWHCHILEHEDNDMMRPFEVVA